MAGNDWRSILAAPAKSGSKTPAAPAADWRSVLSAPPRATQAQQVSALRLQQQQQEEDLKAKQEEFARLTALANPDAGYGMPYVPPMTAADPVRDAALGALDAGSQAVADAAGVQKGEVLLGDRSRAMMTAQGRDVREVTNVPSQQEITNILPSLNQLLGIDRGEDPAMQRRRLLAQQAGMDPTLAGDRSIALQAGAVPNSPRQAVPLAARMMQMLQGESQQRNVSPVTQAIQGSEVKPDNVYDVAMQNGYSPLAAGALYVASDPANIVFEAPGIAKGITGIEGAALRAARAEFERAGLDAVTQQASNALRMGEIQRDTGAALAAHSDDVARLRAEALMREQAAKEALPAQRAKFSAQAAAAQDAVNAQLDESARIAGLKRQAELKAQMEAIRNDPLRSGKLDASRAPIVNAEPPVVPAKAPTARPKHRAPRVEELQAEPIVDNAPVSPQEASNSRPETPGVDSSTPAPKTQPEASSQDIRRLTPPDVDPKTVQYPTAKGITIGIGKMKDGRWKVWHDETPPVVGNNTQEALRNWARVRGEELKRGQTRAPQLPNQATQVDNVPAPATPSSDRQLVKSFLDQRVRGRVAEAATSDADNVQFSYGAAGGVSPAQPGQTAMHGIESVQSPHETFRQTARKLTRMVFGDDKTLVQNNAAGYYRPNANVAALRKAYNMVDGFHELGHAIEHRHKMIGRLSSQGRNELLNLVQNPAQYSPAQLPHEGVAEAMRLYIHDPQSLHQAAPTVARELEAIVQSDDQVRSVLGEAAQNVSDWRNASPEQRIDSVVVDKSKYGTKGTGPSAADKFIAKTADQLVHIERGVERTVGKNARYADDMYKQSRVYRAVANDGLDNALRGKGVPTIKRGADGLIERGHVGESLESVLDFVKSEEQITDFERYLIARRAQELGPGKSPIDLHDADSVIRNTEAKYGAAEIQDRARRYYKFKDHVLQYGVDSGIVSEEGAQAMREISSNHTPFRRRMDIGIDEFASHQFGETNRGLEPGKPGTFKNLKGSFREIVSPLQTDIANLHSILINGEKNLVGQTMGRLIDTHGANSGYALGRNVTVNKFTHANGKTFMAPAPPSNMDHVVKVLTNGKPQYYQLRPEVYESWKTLSQQELSGIAAAALPAQRLVRWGVTSDPRFILNEFFRNPHEYAIVAGDKVKIVHNYGVPALPVLNEPFIRGVASYLMAGLERSGKASSGAGKVAQHLLSYLGSADAVEFYKMYGGKAGMAASLRDEAHYASELSSIVRGFTPQELKTTWLPKGVRGKLDAALRKYHALKESSEDVARVGVAEARYRQGIKSGESATEAKANAAFEARDVLDFSQRGSGVVNDISAIQAFTRPKITGTHRFYRALRRDPVGTTIRGLTSLTVPALLVYAWNRNDPDYAEIPDQEKRYFYHIPYNSEGGVPIPGKAGGPKDFIRIAKPPGIATVYFDELAQRMLNHIDKQDPQAFSGTLTSLIEAQTPFTTSAPFVKLGSLSDAMQILGMNYDPFYHGPVLSPSEQGRLPSDAVSEKTPWLSVRAAQLPGDIAEKFGADRRKYDLAPKAVDRAAQSVIPGVAYRAYRGIKPLGDMVRDGSDAVQNPVETAKGAILGAPETVGLTKHDFNSETLNRLYKRQAFLRQAKKSEALTESEKTDLRDIEKTMRTVNGLKADLRGVDDKTQKDAIMRAILDEVRPYQNRIK